MSARPGVDHALQLAESRSDCDNNILERLAANILDDCADAADTAGCHDLARVFSSHGLPRPDSPPRVDRGFLRRLFR